MKTDKIKIILADDHRLFRQGIKELLKESTLIEVIDESENGEQLIKSYFDKKPDIILVDIAMPVISGYQAFEMIKTQDENVKALFLSMHTEEIYYYQIYGVGGKGLLSKNIFLGELEAAISEIIKGGIYFGPEYTKEKLEEIVEKYKDVGNGKVKKKVHFSERETEVLRLIMEGNTSNEIGDKLHLSRRTIDKHRESIMKKANVKNLMDLYKFALEYF